MYDVIDFTKDFIPYIHRPLDSSDCVAVINLINRWRFVKEYQWLAFKDHVTRIPDVFKQQSHVHVILLLHSFNNAPKQGDKIEKAFLYYRNGTIKELKPVNAKAAGFGILYGAVPEIDRNELSNSTRAAICPACKAERQWWNTYCANTWHTKS